VVTWSKKPGVAGISGMALVEPVWLDFGGRNPLSGWIPLSRGEIRPGITSSDAAGGVNGSIDTFLLGFDVDEVLNLALEFRRGCVAFTAGEFFSETVAFPVTFSRELEFSAHGSLSDSFDMSGEEVAGVCIGVPDELDHDSLAALL
jgi:hypothetical protein